MKWIRLENFFTMAAKSLSARTPKEPVQKHSPLLKEGTAAINASTSAAVLTTLGKPNTA
jgi:hypothetical protein